ncbi:hypothetical protein Fmac_006363 [Flemingia macrophylla]|uniref:Uncharacterized protein n=1 Tax=Flemingia macrophylla TaxID=520843 RepID=A0ABD1NBV9_9FABA
MADSFCYHYTFITFLHCFPSHIMSFFLTYVTSCVPRQLLCHGSWSGPTTTKPTQLNQPGHGKKENQKNGLELEKLQF